MKYVLILILVSCGKVKVETTPIKTSDIQFGPDFEKAIQVCDDRYGTGTQDSEACFLDYRTFLSPKVGVDFNSIASWCKANYTTSVDIKGCQSDLLSIFKNQKPN